MTDFSKLLNPEQCAAATADDGPLLVLAAAGTGKTRTLVHRVACLIERGVPPERILLLTFTNRAAKEMLERAEKVVGDAAQSIWSGTFHSICARFLRRYGSALGYQPGFQIIDEDDQKKLVGDIIKSTVKDPKDFPKKEVVLKMISEAANERRPVGFIAQRWQTKAAGFTPEEIEAVAEKYDARKRELGAMDFDDLLVNGLRLLKEKDRIREMLQEHFLHVLVDEYQDTNGLQAEFTDILAAKHRNIMAVGDDFQCIYTWRGAQIENIMEFPQRWENCRVVKLERNYRSVPGVLDVANVVMRDAPNQFEKMLRPIRGGRGEKPWLYRVYDDRVQAQEILKIVRQAHEIGYRYSDVAVLYRSHYQAIEIEKTLRKTSVPYRLTSGVSFFEKQNVKDALAYLRLILNPADELSFLRLVELLPGVGEKSAKTYWEKLGRTFDGNSKECRDALYGLLGAKAKPVWPPFAKAFECAADHLGENEIGEIVEDFIDLFYEDYAEKEWGDEEAAERVEEVRALGVDIVADGVPLDAYLADIALMTNLDLNRNDPNQDRVTLSTVHQAKGMEWPVVAVPWLSEGMFPSAKADEEGRADEERRLFYVAVTRAKDQLYLFAPTVRKMSDGGMFPVEPSVFVKEIPAELVVSKRVMGDFGAYGGGYGGGYGSYGSYGSGGFRKPVRKSVLSTSWRR